VTKHRGRYRSAIAVTAVLGVGLLAACSSSSSSGSGAQAAAGKLSGSPIKIGLIIPVGATISYPDTVAAAEGAARGVNKRGGIDGRPVQIDFCNDNFDPNKDITCARQLVSDGVIGTAGDFTPANETGVETILAAADIPGVGTYDFAKTGFDTNSYLLTGSGVLYNAAQTAYSVKAGGPRVGSAIDLLPLDDGFTTSTRKIITSLGGTYSANVGIPSSAIDLSPEATTLTDSKPGAIYVDGSEAQGNEIAKDMDGLGYTGKFVYSAASISAQGIGQLGKAASQLVLVSPYPPLTAAATVPGLKQFISDMAAEKAAGDQNAPTSHAYVRDESMSSYLAVEAIAKIANSAKAATAKQLKTALNQAKNVDLGGIIPPWTPNKSVIKSIPRDSNSTFYAYTWNNGDPKLISSKPIDVAKYAS
jgi:ABC-type branched-subunit amino acid transport system substrate-binding protein